MEESCAAFKKESPWVRIEGNQLILWDSRGRETIRELPPLETVDILENTKSVEVFVGGVEYSFSQWLY